MTSLKEITTAWMAAVMSAGLAFSCGSRVIEEGCPPGYICFPECAGGSNCYGSFGDAGATYTFDGGSKLDAGTTPAGGPYPSGSVPPTRSSSSTLAFNVVDAEQSRSLSSLVIISDSPSNALHIFNVKTNLSRSVALPVPPVAVAVAPDGLTAAVAYDAHVSWVDLQSGTVRVTCNLGSDAYDLAMSAENVAYVLPKTDQWISIHAVDLTTCTETLSTENVYAHGHIAMHPSGKALFAADQGLSPDEIDRCDLTVSPIACGDSQQGANWGTYSFCGNLWMSGDGARVYSACRVALNIPGAVTGPVCTYGGKLDGTGRIRHLSEAPLAQKIVWIPDVPPYTTEPSQADADTVVNINESAYLGLTSTIQLPGGPSGNARGLFVFTERDLSAIYVITSGGEPSAGTTGTGPFAIETLVP